MERPASTPIQRTRKSRENFPVLSVVLPKRYHPPFAAIYDFCRRADDLGDTYPNTPPTDDDRADALARLAEFRSQLRATLDPEADPASTPMPQLASTVRTHNLPHKPFHDLLDAFERDQRQSTYQTWDDLLSYCGSSADPVGRLVLAVGGIDLDAPASAELVRQSDLICTGLQIANHIQDLGRDLTTLGRVYLPIQDTGLDPDRLAALKARPNDHEARLEVIKAVRPLVVRTRGLFEDASTLPNQLAASRAAGIAKAVWLFRASGLAVLDAIERRGCTTLWVRPKVGVTAKLALIAHAAIAPPRPLQGGPTPTTEAQGTDA